MEPIELITSRLRLRNYTSADLDFVMSMWNDPEMGKYMPDPAYDDIDESYRKALNELQDDEECRYLIAERSDTGERIGACSFLPSPDGRIYDLGYSVHSDHWNQGYATEMAQAMIDHAQANGAEKITAPVHQENIASNAVMKKLGFTVIGETSCKKYGTGRLLPEYLYELSLS
ncbi:Acetyltransferase (GNAT) domain protein [anaerobic digester metagenome]